MQYSDKIELTEYLDKSETELRQKLEKAYHMWASYELTTVSYMNYVRELLDEHIERIEKF